MAKNAELISIKRGFGSDRATYSTEDGAINVDVFWALLAPYGTRITINGDISKTFLDNRYVQPTEALNRIGYTPDIDVDFTALSDRATKFIQE